MSGVSCAQMGECPKSCEPYSFPLHQEPFLLLVLPLPSRVPVPTLPTHQMRANRALNRFCPRWLPESHGVTASNWIASPDPGNHRRTMFLLTSSPNTVLLWKCATYSGESRLYLPTCKMCIGTSHHTFKKMMSTHLEGTTLSSAVLYVMHTKTSV